MSEQDVLNKCKSICDQMTKEYNEAKAPVYIEVKPGLRVDARCPLAEAARVRISKVEPFLNSKFI